jgi:flagellar protein FlaJ
MQNSQHSAFTGRHHHEINKLEQSLQQFLRDMTEYKKIGYDVILAIFRLSQENLYNSVFNKKLNELKILLDSGTTPTTSVKAIEFRSWFTKISFFLIAYIAEYGGGNPKTLETINRFISNARQAIKEGKASISALTLIIFGAPVIMAFTAAMILNIMGSVDASTFEGFQSQQGSQLGFEQNLTKLVMVTPEFIGMINVLIVTSSILGAFVITKAIDFTFYNTWRVVVLGLIAAASVLFIDSFGSINLDSFSDNLPF